MLRAPRSLMAPVEPAVLPAAVAASPLQAKYGRRSTGIGLRAARRPARSPAAARTGADTGARSCRTRGRRSPSRHRAGGSRAEAPPEDDVVGTVLGSSAFRAFARSAASALGREITRGIFGTRRRRR